MGLTIQLVINAGSRSLSAGHTISVNERVAVFGGLGKGNCSNKI